MSAILGHHSHVKSSWHVAQGIALGRHLGAVRNEESLAVCAADHLLMGFHLGAVRCEASLAIGTADHQLVEF